MLPVLHFIPSHREKFFSRLNKLSTDTVIFDLEDGVPSHLRGNARSILLNNKNAIESLNSFIRINKEEGVYEAADIQIIKEIKFKGVVIPKVESIDDIESFLDLISVTGTNFKIICLIESYKGLEGLSRICEQVGEKIYAVGLGLEDFLSEVPVVVVKNYIIEYIKLKLVAICKAYSLLSIDTVSLNYRENINEFRKECLASRDFFFDGRFSIHPTQIPIINEVYSPTDDEIIWAQSIMEKINGQKNIGYQKVGEEVISTPKVKKAQLILKKAGAYNV